MNLSVPEIEQIVLLVMEQLQTPEPASRAERNATISKSRSVEGVALTAPVITQELLESMANGSTSIRIGPRAILTPSARDFLRAHSIKCVREEKPASVKNTTRWQAIITKMTPAVAAALDDMSDSSVRWDRHLLSLVTEASQQAISAICRGEAKAVVVFTDQPEFVACFANRNDQVRAAVVTTAQAIADLRQRLNPNVLAINPVNKSAFELRKIMQAFSVETK